MTPTAEVQSKRYDDEETLEEQALRLVQKETQRLSDHTRHARDKYRRHVKRLSSSQRQHLAAYLRSDFERTIGVVEDFSDESPEFSFGPNWTD